MNQPTVVPGPIPEVARTARVKKLHDLLVWFCLNTPGYEAEVTGLEDTGAKNQTRARYLAIQRIIRKEQLPLSVHKRGATLWVRREENK